MCIHLLRWMAYNSFYLRFYIFQREKIHVIFHLARPWGEKLSWWFSPLFRWNIVENRKMTLFFYKRRHKWCKRQTPQRKITRSREFSFWDKSSYGIPYGEKFLSFCLLLHFFISKTTFLFTFAWFFLSYISNFLPLKWHQNSRGWCFLWRTFPIFFLRNFTSSARGEEWHCLKELTQLITKKLFN